jgi:hypothetical protein
MVNFGSQMKAIMVKNLKIGMRDFWSYFLILVVPPACLFIITIILSMLGDRDSKVKLDPFFTILIGNVLILFSQIGQMRAVLVTLVNEK